MIKISILIPNYNGEQLLKKNLSRVFASAEHYTHKAQEEVEIILIDDYSTDNSLDYLKNKKVKVIKNTKNLGFSSTVNIGVKEAKGEIIILLNTDVAPEENFIEPLIGYFTNKEVFAVGCMDKSIEGEKTILRGRGIGKWQRGFLIHKKGEVDKQTTLWVSGGSGAFRRSIWEKLGGFSEFYNPFYWEDIDLSYRALKSGYKIVFEPKSIVAHEHEKGAIKTKYSAFQIKTIAYRNQIIFAWSNISDYTLLLSHIFWLPSYLVRAIFTGDLSFILGFVKAIILLPAIVLSRSRIHKYFTKGDQEVITELE